MPDRRRAGLLVLLVVLAGAFLLTHAPLEFGAIRLGGVSLLWWYVGAGGPLVAVLVTVLALGQPGGPGRPRDDGSRAAASPPSRGAVPRANATDAGAPGDRSRGPALPT